MKSLKRQKRRLENRGDEMPDRDGKGSRARSPMPKGKKKGRQQGNC